MVQQSCPLCDIVSTYCVTRAGVGKRFTCKVCGEFWISMGAERKLSNHSPAWRAALSAKAKGASDGKVLVIRLPNPPNEHAPIVEEMVDRARTPECQQT